MTIKQFEDLIISELTKVVDAIVKANLKLDISAKSRAGAEISDWLEEKFVEATKKHKYFHNSESAPKGSTKNPWDARTKFRLDGADEELWIDFKAFKITSAANNSLYVFSLRENSDEAVQFLKYLTGLLNSELITFYAQQEKIIRYSKGKQPQIKTSDLYTIPIPEDKSLQSKVISLVDKIYQKNGSEFEAKEEIDNLIFDYFNIDKNEVIKLKGAIESF